MNTKNTLNTFILVYPDGTKSPKLTTTREYGRWLIEAFDGYTCINELFMKSKKTGSTTLENHPGSRIGKWFDDKSFDKYNLRSWYIYQDSEVIEKLKKYKLCEKRDCIPISVNDKDHRRLLRTYTLNQMDLYIRSTMDKNFNISSYVGLPYQIKLGKFTDTVIKPECVAPKKRKLF